MKSLSSQCSCFISHQRLHISPSSANIDMLLFLRAVMNMNIAKSYNDLPVSFRSITQRQDYPVLNAVYLNISSHFIYFSSFLFSLFCFCTKCKTFCQKRFRLPTKVLKETGALGRQLHCERSPFSDTLGSRFSSFYQYRAIL